MFVVFDLKFASVLNRQFVIFSPRVSIPDTFRFGFSVQFSRNLTSHAIVISNNRTDYLAEYGARVVIGIILIMSQAIFFVQLQSNIAIR